eukprot:TRINITY_DN16166_c0_g1_i6.p1 TRINITY_DN16166_c0_g1~~TRINITY_DN16166_c0_g1_i6.p1  ORF type:complete len:581 (+),score=98.15 TRINITY_DN16166_c0_g1_i6:191-1933(+)
MEDDFVMVEDSLIVSDNKVILDCTNEKEITTTGNFRAYAALNLVGPVIEDSDETGKRPNLAITAVLDRSGSMANGKMNLTKMAMHFVTEQLQQDDLFGIVAYDNVVETKFQLTYANVENQAMFDKQIDSIQCRGSTNLSGGLLSGIEQQVQGNSLLKEGTIRAILLCTDGLANTGISNIERLTKITSNLIGHEKNLRVHTFGFGSDHDPRMLTSIAEAGKGDFFYVENDEAIPQAFGNVLGGLLSVAAQNVRVVITPIDPSFKIIQVCDKVINQKFEANGSVSFTLRDLMSEVKRKLLFKYTIGKTDKEGIQEVAKININYFNVATEINEIVSCTLSLNRKNIIPNNVPFNPEVSSNIARVKTATTIQEATSSAESGDLNSAQTIIQQALQSLRQLNLQDKSYEKQLLDDLRKLQIGFQDQVTYQQQGRYYGYAANHSTKSQTPMFRGVGVSTTNTNRQGASPYGQRGRGRGCYRGGVGGGGPPQTLVGARGMFPGSIRMKQGGVPLGAPDCVLECVDKDRGTFKNLCGGVEGYAPNYNVGQNFTVGNFDVAQQQQFQMTKQQLKFQQKAAEYSKSKSEP